MIVQQAQVGAAQGGLPSDSTKSPKSDSLQVPSARDEA